MWLSQLNMMKKNSSLTIEEIAEKSGVPIGTLFKIFSGQTKDPKLGTIRSIVHCLGYTLDDLTPNTKNKVAPLYTSEALKMAKQYDQLDSWGKSAVEALIHEELARCTASAPVPQEENLIELNFNELKASAGTGWDLMEESMTPWTVKLNDLTRKADFCLAVEGDSMEPKFQSGDPDSDPAAALCGGGAVWLVHIGRPRLCKAAGLRQAALSQPSLPGHLPRRIYRHRVQRPGAGKAGAGVGCEQVNQRTLM